MIAASRPHRRPPSPPGFAPARVLEVELGRPLEAIDPVVAVDGPADARGQGAHGYRRARVLVRLHGRPLGTIELDLAEGSLEERALADVIWSSLAGEITQHLARDGGQVVDRLPLAGLGAGPCLEVLPLPGPPAASVVVATRDRPPAVVACIDRLLSLDYPRYEVVVVDNAPRSEATAGAVGQRYGSRSQVRYVREDRPGLSNARNRGLDEAVGEVVAFTDDDVVVDSDWLANLVAAFGVASHVACVTGLILPAELETPAQVWLEEFGGFAKGYRRRLFDLTEHRVADPLYPYTMGRFGSGASLAFRACALRELGGFAPELGAGTAAAGGEDLDVFFRVLASGSAIVYEPGAILYHRHCREYSQLRRQLHDYGVGLGAALAKCLLDRPRRALDLAGRLPAGVAYLLGPRSPKNRGKGAGFPPELSRLELMGLARGPVRYLRSRREADGGVQGRQGRAARRGRQERPSAEGGLTSGSFQARTWSTSR